MNARGDTQLRIAWGRALIAIGLVIAFLALAALEMLTARLPGPDEGVAGPANSDHHPVWPWGDSLDIRESGVSEKPDATSVTGRGEVDRAVAVASDGSHLR
jgi:hypothetical protein